MYYQYVLTSCEYSFSNYKRLLKLFKGDVHVGKRSLGETSGHLYCLLEFEAPRDTLPVGILLDVEYVMLYLNRALDPCTVFINRMFGVYPAITSLEITSV